MMNFRFKRSRASRLHGLVTRFAVVLGALFGIAAFADRALAADQLQQVLIHFEVDAKPVAPYVDLATQEIFFSFEGGMSAVTVDPATGRITGHSAQNLGRFGPAVVGFKLNPAVPITSSGFLTFNCTKCEIEFNPAGAGARLKQLLPPDARFPDPVRPDEPFRTLAFNIPMQGTFLQNLGALAPARAGTVGFGIRGFGCGGTHEVRGQGLLAQGRGTICMNGQFDISTPDSDQFADFLEGAVDAVTGLLRPDAVQAFIELLAGTTFKGGSDCPITLHIAQP
jgi:hypothetical protein